MKKISKTNWSLENIEIITPILKSGGIGVLPTDTLYGIVGSALFPEAVERIYKLRKRNKKKPLIILIGSLGDLQLFSIELDLQTKEILNQLWPAKVSVVLPCSQEKLEYLHRTNKTLAFRVPDDEGLRTLLEKTGPLVAPSANFEGEKPAQTIAEAKKYFGEKIDFYIDFGKRTSKPSTLVEIENGKVSVIREGAVKIASQALAFKDKFMNNDFKKIAVSAARKAGIFLLKEFEHFNRNLVEVKSHGQILTQADLGSEKIIIQEIKTAFPDHAILSEESGGDGIKSEYLWVIDPIDGTTNFSFHNPLWSISIGLVRNGEIVLGVVYVPTLKEMYVAEKGKGANRNGKPIHVSSIATERALHTFCHGSSKRDIEVAMEYATNMKEQRIDCRQLGSAAIELAYVASGRVESFVIPGTKPWDVAAGVLLVKEAGGIVTDFDNKSFILKTVDMVASNGLVHNELLKILEKI